MTVAAFLDWLVTGTHDQTLSPEWLQEKCPQHAQWTQAQQQPGMALITADSAEMARRAFWARQAEKKPRVVRDNLAPWKVGQK